MAKKNECTVLLQLAMASLYCISMIGYSLQLEIWGVWSWDLELSPLKKFIDSGLSIKNENSRVTHRHWIILKTTERHWNVLNV